MPQQDLFNGAALDRSAQNVLRRYVQLARANPLGWGPLASDPFWFLILWVRVIWIRALWCRVVRFRALWVREHRCRILWLWVPFGSRSPLASGPLAPGGFGFRPVGFVSFGFELFGLGPLWFRVFSFGVLWFQGFCIVNPSLLGLQRESLQI